MRATLSFLPTQANTRDVSGSWKRSLYECLVKSGLHGFPTPIGHVGEQALPSWMGHSFKRRAGSPMACHMTNVLT